MKVSILKISDFSEVDINKIKQYISEEKRRKVDKFFKREDKLRGIYGELLIRKIIIDKLKINNKDIKFQMNKYGKLYLKDIENLYFNISHSEEYVVCCLDNKPVGIDIEMIKPFEIKVIVENFFTISDQNYILGKNTLTTSKEITNKFYEIWTLKESFIKCVGKGLYSPLNEFNIYFDKKGEINIDTKKTENKYFFKQITIDKAYKTSICSQGSIKINELNYIMPKQLINEFYYKYGNFE